MTRVPFLSFFLLLALRKQLALISGRWLFVVSRAKPLQFRRLLVWCVRATRCPSCCPGGYRCSNDKSSSWSVSWPNNLINKKSIIKIPDVLILHARFNLEKIVRFLFAWFYRHFPFVEYNIVMCLADNNGDGTENKSNFWCVSAGRSI